VRPLRVAPELADPLGSLEVGGASGRGAVRHGELDRERRGVPVIGARVAPGSCGSDASTRRPRGSLLCHGVNGVLEDVALSACHRRILRLAQTASDK
jgi:hypothetical protein